MSYKELRNYGLNIIIKDYANYPRYLPLPCHMDHGWNADNKPLNSDLKTKKPLMMVFSSRFKKAWGKNSNIPVEIMGMPFIHYKNMHKLSQKKDASGTVAFPCHSTYFLKHKLDIEQYCATLKKLPKEFQPVTICLFWLDYIDKAEIYRKNGFKVVTAGYKITNSLSFVKNFYNILSSHKYSTSDSVGSHTFYSINFGIPFFITSKCPELINIKHGDPNIEESTFLNEFEYGKKAYKLFSTGPAKTISKAQIEFVNNESGIKDCLTRKQMNILFWKYFHKNHYGYKSIIPYLITTIWAYMLFNGPWIKSLMSVRKWMVDEQKIYSFPKLNYLKYNLGYSKIAIKHLGISKFILYILHYINNTIYSPSRIQNYKKIQQLFINKNGFEIGGPSKFFTANGPLPIYHLAKTIDNINYHQNTIWTHDTNSEIVLTGKHIYSNRYIADATKLNKIKTNKYDFFICCNVLEHIANPLLAIEQILDRLPKDGLILIIVPKKESNFDRKRPVTTFDHLLEDYKNNVNENDLTHINEILELHDTQLDPLAGSASKFKARCLKNPANRCLHHHVFDNMLLKKIYKYFGIKIIEAITIHTDYIILGQKTKVHNEKRV